MSKNNAVGNALQKGEINSRSSIKIIDGPPSRNNFRSGWWSVEIGGFAFLVFSSIPCYDVPLPDQHDILTREIRDFLTGKRRALQSKIGREAKKQRGNKMKATLPKEEIYVARQAYDEKEQISSYTLVVNTRAGLRHPVTVRWYMGRAASATTVYCNVYGPGFSGAGSAGGGGYCKRSAAFDEACRRAGVELSKSVSGVGMRAVEDAMLAIARAAGYNGRTIIVRN